MKAKGFSSRIALAVLAAASVAASGWAQTVVPVQIRLLAINDFHGNLEPPAGRDGMVNGVQAGGVEYLATHLRQAGAGQPNTLVVGAGDIFGGSPLISALFQERPAVEAMNALGLKVTALGNHELDHGPVELKKRLKDEAAGFDYLAANAEWAGKPGQTLFPATEVRTIGGVKIGFIGEILEGADQVISKDAGKDLRFLEESRVANEAAARLEREGVHAIVLLIHVGGRQHPDSGPPDPNGCANLDGEIVGVVKKLSPSIKLVLSGHTHLSYNCQIDGHTVTQAEAYGRLFTQVDLSIDPKTDKIVDLRAKNVVVTRDVAKDPAETAILEHYRPLAEKESKRVVGSIAQEIHRASTPAGGSQLAEVIADAQREHTGAQIAFMNIDGVRAELVEAPGVDGVRAVTFGDLYSAQPFGNRVMSFNMTGEMIGRLLEQQFTGRKSPNILDVSDGFSYQYRLHAPDGQHVVPGSIMLHGKPIGPTDVVRVETNDFLSAGASGFWVFREGTDRVLGEPDVDALVDYFKAHSPVKPGPQNRIVRVD